MAKRAFLIVLDSMGIGEMPDSADWKDEGSNTLRSISAHPDFNCPNLEKLGLFNIDGVEVKGKAGVASPRTCYARMAEASRGKDTTIGHWEISGIYSEKPLPVYPNGFPKEIIEKFEEVTGRGTLCNLPYSGTEVIKDFGQEHLQTGKLIVYTSADSVFQIAAHEDVISVQTLYRYCEQAREILCGDHAVGRVIARPFNGEYPFARTSRRHDYALPPPKNTMADVLKEKGYDVISVGKIYDIFCGKGFTSSYPTVNNADGMDKTLLLVQTDFEGLCFINLVDFDMVYGHRNDVGGYARAMTEFDKRLGELLPLLREDDLLIITADHGCDPATPSTDHSREHTPMLAYGAKLKQGVNLGTRDSFADIGSTVLEWFGLDSDGIYGTSFLKEIIDD
ncbi:MAG: phosphopentomutase [Clostridia bacterium]|nr:phosphopentomutase [Clostridia bacterium]